MKKLKVSLFLVLGLLLVLEVSGQNNKSSKRQIGKIARNCFISPSLARKLSLFIQMNERAYIVCNGAICERKGYSVPSSEVERIVVNLDKSKDYPKYLTIRLYQTFGVQLMYFALKNYMSIKEIDVLEAVWNDELARIEKEHEKNSKNDLINTSNLDSSIDDNENNTDEASFLNNEDTLSRKVQEAESNMNYSYSLSGRRIVYNPFSKREKYPERGKLCIIIEVASSGKVINTKVSLKQTNFKNKDLIDLYLSKTKEFIFNEIPINNSQTGYICLIFP